MTPGLVREDATFPTQARLRRIQASGAANQQSPKLSLASGAALASFLQSSTFLFARNVEASVTPDSFSTASRNRDDQEAGTLTEPRQRNRPIQQSHKIRVCSMMLHKHVFASHNTRSRFTLCVLHAMHCLSTTYDTTTPI